MPLERDPATVLDIVIAARCIQQFIAEQHYERIDPVEIWTTATRDVPELLAILEPLLPEQEDDRER